MLLIAHLPLMGGVTPLPALLDDRLASPRSPLPRPLSRTRFFLLSSTTATGSPWKPLRDIRRGWGMEREKGTTRDREREREGGDMKRLVCYHMTTPHPLLTSNPPKPTPTAPHFNAEPLTQNNCPSTQTHSGPPYTYLCLPRILLSPIILLSIPLLSRQAARMAGMETFTDGSTGKFSHPQKQKEKRKLF